MAIALSVAAVESGVRPFDRQASPARAPYTDWWTDFFWHRVMFKQSVYQWGPEEVYGTVLRLTRSRTEFTTTRHLQLLIQAHNDAADFEHLIRRAMAGEMHTIKQYFPHPDALHRIHNEMGFGRWEAEALLAPSNGRPIDPHSVPWIHAALRGWPCQNPITRLWELRQMQNQWIAVLYQLADARYDLGKELSERIDPSALWVIDPTTRPAALASYARERGEPGDPRRVVPHQVYAPLPPEPKPETQLRTLPHHIVVKAGLNHW